MPLEIAFNHGLLVLEEVMVAAQAHTHTLNSSLFGAMATEGKGQISTLSYLSVLHVNFPLCTELT